MTPEGELAVTSKSTLLLTHFICEAAGCALIVGSGQLEANAKLLKPLIPVAGNNVVEKIPDEFRDDHQPIE